MRNFFIIILLAGTFGSFSQKITDDLKKMREAIQNSNTISSDVLVIGYKDKSDKKGSVIGTGMLRKAKNSYYSKFDSDELISNKNCTLIIDHNDKSVTWFEP